MWLESKRKKKGFCKFWRVNLTRTSSDSNSFQVKVEFFKENTVLKKFSVLAETLMK